MAVLRFSHFKDKFHIRLMLRREMADLKAEERIVVVACSENGLSYEFEGVQNGQLTYYFVEQGTTCGYADICTIFPAQLM
ncbi:MAG: hypothetical protein QXQ41_01130 [Candidatus Bathyarchaeia archaeon]